MYLILTQYQALYLFLASQDKWAPTREKSSGFNLEGVNWVSIMSKHSAASLGSFFCGQKCGTGH